MNDEDQEDLLIHVSESDSSSAESDAYLDDGRVIPFVQHNEDIHQQVRCCSKTRIEFLCSGAVLLITSTVLLILLPLYSDSVNVVADVSTQVLFTSVISTMILLVWTYLYSQTKLCQSTSLTKRLKPPFRSTVLLQAGLAQGIGGLLVIFSSDSRKVSCHWEDPIKATTLVFALIFYFVFSRKLMGLPRIFCATTIIVGLFVCLDYGLCDEFRCRGWVREDREEDTGQWKLAVHFLSASSYIAALAIWTFHLFLVEAGLDTLHLGNFFFERSHHISSLSTVSCIVSGQEGSVENSVPLLSSAQPRTDNNKQQANSHSAGCGAQPGGTQSKPSALVLASWLHIISATVVVLFFWVDMIPHVLEASSWVRLANFTQRGLLCHVGLLPVVEVQAQSQGQGPGPGQADDCGMLPLLGWMVAACLAVFSVSAANVLIFSRSAVLTVAVMTSALPLGNVFWSFFRLPPNSGGVVEWWPSLSAEFVCTLVGLPIIGAGLYLLCRSEFSESGQHRDPCCTLRFHQRNAPAT